MEITNFINFSLQRAIYNSCPIDDGELVESAFKETVLDSRYHSPEISTENVKNNILRNTGWLPVFFYRLLRKMEEQGYEDSLKYQIHFLMKVLCGCEIYWSSEIDEGFYVVHGVGTVIGARSKIGKGFRIYQGCTVGQKDLKHKEKVPKIGNDVTLFSNSQILGDVTIGDNSIIAASSLVINNIEENQLVAGNPAKQIKTLL
jgi:serine O-acetyltransferase